MADAIIVNAGQAVGQGDWEALAAQHGGVKSTSPRAATEAEIKAAGMGQDDDPSFSQRPIYRYYFNDGTFVEARTAANGADYQVVDYKPSAQFTQAQTRAATQAAKPVKSEAEQATEAAQAQTTQIAAQRAQADKDEEDWNANPANIPNGASGRRETHRARDERLQKEKEAAEAKNKPGAPTIKDDGAGGLVAIQSMPDGSIKTTPIPGIRGKPDTIDHEGVKYERQPDGSYAPAKGIPAAGIGIKNVDQFVPDYSQPDLGMGAWAAKQRQKIGLPPDQGGITQKDYDSAVTSAREQATVTITNVATNQGVVRQQALDNQSREDKQAEYAENDLTRKQNVFDSIWKYTTPDSEAIRAWMPDAQSAQALRKQYAGDAKPMPALHPMFTSLATGAGVTPPPGAAPAAPKPPAPVPPAVTAAAAQASGAAPAPAAGAAPAIVPAAPPSTLQSPGIAGMMSPPGEPDPRLSGPQSPGEAGMMSPPGEPDPRSGATINGTQGEPSFVFEAGPRPVAAPAPSEIGPTPPVGGTVLPGPWNTPETAPEQAPPDGGVVPATAPPPAPWQTDQGGGAFPQIPAIPRAGNEAGGNVMKVMPQGPVSGWAMQALAQPTGTVAVQPQQAGQPMNPALQTAQAGAQQSLFDPYQTAGRMATWGVPQDAIAQALRELGWIDEVPA